MKDLNPEAAWRPKARGWVFGECPMAQDSAHAPPDLRPGCGSTRAAWGARDKKSGHHAQAHPGLEWGAGCGGPMSEDGGVIPADRKRRMGSRQDSVGMRPTGVRGRSVNPGKEIPAVCGRRFDSALRKGAFAVRSPVFAPVSGDKGGFGCTHTHALWGWVRGGDGAGRWAKKMPTLWFSGRVWARPRARPEPAGGRKAALAACDSGPVRENGTWDRGAVWWVARWCGGAPGGGVAAKKSPRLLRGELIPGCFCRAACVPRLRAFLGRRGGSARGRGVRRAGSKSRPWHDAQGAGGAVARCSRGAVRGLRPRWQRDGRHCPRRAGIAWRTPTPSSAATARKGGAAVWPGRCSHG